ncbi:hypothetical protein [Paraburkholderia sp. BL17N1]|uniref:hypothetical protein n=1 Tax=Paraburkholderia sp. BL17N1 TaxID=1938798 RepID=UPI001A7E6DF9|nr:hypothetical protein [Paraburkholderia sp. BL17N1]
MKRARLWPAARHPFQPVTIPRPVRRISEGSGHSRNEETHFVLCASHDASGSETDEQVFGDGSSIRRSAPLATIWTATPVAGNKTFVPNEVFVTAGVL